MEQKVVSLVVWSFVLTLSYELILELNNCYYVLLISQNIIFISCLDTNGFHIFIKDKYFSILCE